MAAQLQVVAEPKSYEYHPLSELFPVIDGEEFAALVADIKERGLRELIVIHEEKILDGRNRYRACLEADVVPRFKAYDGDDPVGEVLSLNLRRRHLDESQRAMVADKLANMAQGARTDIAQIQATSQADAAKKLSVSRSSVQSARKVRATGAPELVKAVENGEMKLNKAVVLANAPAEQQRTALAGGKKEVAATVKAIRQATKKPAEDFDPDLEVDRATRSLRATILSWSSRPPDEQTRLYKSMTSELRRMVGELAPTRKSA